MKLWASFLFIFGLSGCPKGPDLTGGTPAEDSLRAPDFASPVSIPASSRVKFSAKLRVPGRAIPSLPGVLLVDSPRFRMILNGPIGGAVFTAIANEGGMLVLDHREGRALTVGTDEETGLGSFGVQDVAALTTTLLGRLPATHLPELTLMSHEGEEWRYRSQREDGSWVELGLNALGHLAWLESYQPDGSSLLRLEHEEWQEFSSEIPMEAERLQEHGPIRLPKRSRLVHKGSSVELILKFSLWQDLMEVGPSAFETDVPEGIEVLTLQEAMQVAEEQAGSDD